MKPELRKELEAELDHLSARVEAIKVLLETPETTPVARPAKSNKVKEPEKTDGRKLRWQTATPDQRKAWANAIRKGQKSRKRRSR